MTRYHARSRHATIATNDLQNDPTPRVALIRERRDGRYVWLNPDGEMVADGLTAEQANVLAARILDRVHGAMEGYARVTSGAAAGGGAVGLVQGLQELTRQLTDDPNYNWLKVSTETAKGAAAGALLCGRPRGRCRPRAGQSGEHREPTESRGHRHCPRRRREAELIRKRECDIAAAGQLRHRAACVLFRARPCA